MEKFQEKFQEAISRWPEKIDITDGQLLGENAFFSGSLWSLHLEIEGGLPESDVWLDMMSWSIYNVLHKNAIELIKKGIYTLEPAKIEVSEYRDCFYENLKDADECYKEIINTMKNEK